MTGPEATIERKVCADAERCLGILHSKLGKDGMPDQIFWLPGAPVLIEFKAPGEQPTKKQWHQIHFLRGLHYDAQWFDDYQRAYDYLAAAVGACALHAPGRQVPARARTRGAVRQTRRQKD
jgi:hypothetical protein